MEIFSLLIKLLVVELHFKDGQELEARLHAVNRVILGREPSVRDDGRLA